MLKNCVDMSTQIIAKQLYYGGTTLDSLPNEDVWLRVYEALRRYCRHRLLEERTRTAAYTARKWGPKSGVDAMLNCTLSNLAHQK